MKALITGVSRGIGKSFALYLSSIGYDIIGVSRNINQQESLKNELKTNLTMVCMDLEDTDNAFKLYEMFKDEKIDIFINNAGFGTYGAFTDTDINDEISMIKLNVVSNHILTKLFLTKFTNENHGIFINVASTASFMMGPLFSSYYASKAYVLRYTQSLCEEVKRKARNVKVCILCPGPVKTSFDQRAGIKNSFNGMSAHKVAKYAIKKALKGKMVIIPGISNKLCVFFSKFIPQRLLSKINYNIQIKKSA